MCPEAAPAPGRAATMALEACGPWTWGIVRLLVCYGHAQCHRVLEARATLSFLATGLCPEPMVGCVRVCLCVRVFVYNVSVYMCVLVQMRVSEQSYSQVSLLCPQPFLLCQGQHPLPVTF